MKIFIITVGSRGDVQPYVALGKGLKGAGHHVTICTCSSFESFIKDHGLDYGYMNNGSSAKVTRERHLGVAETIVASSLEVVSGSVCTNECET